MICIPIDTRPTIIKISPIVRELTKRKIDFFIVHTGQHYSFNMDEIFFKQLGMPEPKYNLKIGSGTNSQQVAKGLIGLEKVFTTELPELVLIHGDANMVPAASIAAVKLHIKAVHKEAGLRSYNRKMPEETNRIIADHICDFLFTPTENSKSILLKEGIEKDKLFVTGNTIVDAVNYNIRIAEEMKIDLPEDFILLTMHRAENVDDKLTLKNILDGIGLIGKKYGQIVWPIHPRSKKMIETFGIVIPDCITTIDPIGYFEFLKYMKYSKLILTDSGGVVEEACTLRVPCATIRTETERPESLDVGSNIVAGVSNPEKILNSAEAMINKKRDWENPFGDGEAAKKIVNLMEKMI
jgi:UDP-N-acetylglucosamine 2-epimerase (non-hydrolysing)